MANSLATALAERVGDHLGDRPGLARQKMFGGFCFMLHGNMLVCPTRDGALIVRVGKEGMEAALARPGAARMDMNGRSMAGFVVVSGDAIEDEDDLGQWLDLAEAFVITLPPK